MLGKTPKEIYAMFNGERVLLVVWHCVFVAQFFVFATVTEELTPEEEEEVRKENPWLEDN